MPWWCICATSAPRTYNESSNGRYFSVHIQKVSLT